MGSDDTVPTTIDNETDEILSENEMKLASSFDTADTISVNTSYSGSLVNYDSVNYYKFTLSRPGYVSFSFSHDFVDSGNEYWDLNLYSSDDLNNELLSRSYIGNELNSINSYGTGLPTGTYYIKINHHSWNWSDVKYTFTVKYVDSDYYEKEKNDGVDTSSNIALNQNYSGNLMTNGDVDWYKFSLSKAGYVSFKFSHDFVDSSNNYYELHLFSSDDLNNELLDRAYIGNELYEVNSYGSGLPAGTYYIKINHYYWNWSDVKYTFSVNCDYSDYYETETNNSSSSADMVKLNSIYTGNLMVYSDSDYYMFSLVKDGYVSITFSHDYVDHDATYWELHLYNSTNLNDKITSYSYVGNDRNQTTTQPVSLSAGTYYVKIDHPYYWSDCIYHFRVNTVLNLSLDSNPIAVGGTTRLNVSNNQGGALSFSSSDTSVATIDSSGKITGKNVGTAKIIVKAAATGNSSAISNSIKIQVVGLGATSKLTVGNASNGIKLGWKKVTGASKYIIYRNNKRIAVVKGNSKVTYTDKSTLKNGAKYTYKIVAASDTTTSKTSKSVTIYRLSKEKLSSVKNKKSRKMIVKYGKNAKATGYQIQYSPSSSFSYGNKTVKVKGAKNSAKTISNLTWGNTYYVRVRAYKSAGGKTFYSAWSSKKKIKISK